MPTLLLAVVTLGTSQGLPGLVLEAEERAPCLWLGGDGSGAMGTPGTPCAGVSLAGRGPAPPGVPQRLPSSCAPGATSTLPRFLLGYGTRGQAPGSSTGGPVSPAPQLVGVTAGRGLGGDPRCWGGAQHGRAASPAAHLVGNRDICRPAPCSHAAVVPHGCMLPGARGTLTAGPCTRVLQPCTLAHCSRALWVHPPHTPVSVTPTLAHSEGPLMLTPCTLAVQLRTHCLHTHTCAPLTRLQQCPRSSSCSHHCLVRTPLGHTSALHTRLARTSLY